MKKAARRGHAMAIASLLVVLGMAAPVLAGATSKATRPGAPRSVHAVGANASATVSWVKPSSSGGAPIKGYVVTSHPSNKTCAAKTTKCKVTGLHNGTAYTFTVVAKNSVGAGARSTASNKVTPSAATTGPKITVSPNSSLTNGESVTVSGSGFKASDQVYLVECLANASGESNCDIATATAVTISASGTLPSTSFKVVTGTVGNGTCGTSSSDLGSCDVSAGNASGGDSASAAITFKSP